MARALGQRSGVHVSHSDRYDGVELPGHRAWTDPVRHPHLPASPVEDRTWMWVETTPEDLVKRWLQTTPERFQLTPLDLQARSSQPPIVAEG